MPKIRLVLLWHMHQPFYKDLISGEYRLPWVRLHALKDYYGMVKLLDEFPTVHQTFNLVPALIIQIQDYVNGTAQDKFLEVVTKPAAELNGEERRFALQYLFQAHPDKQIGRYQRYAELREQFVGLKLDPVKAEMQFSDQDFADLQVLSQIAWFDEFFLDDPKIAALVKKGRNFTRQDQMVILAKQREIIAAVLPAYRSAAERGLIEISTSPYYHPILPLVCDTHQGRASSPGLPLPQNRFQHPEDAREQLLRGLLLHQEVFGKMPSGVWPSEGSVSEEVFSIASELGVQWMASDEGVLGRTINCYFERSSDGVLTRESAETLYRVWRFAQDKTRMHLLFRDHSLSDLIGFVYAGMPAGEAAQHFIDRIKKSAQHIVNAGQDAVVPVILDGENAWEYFPYSGREFLRTLYGALAADPDFECLTMSEAIAKTPEAQMGALDRLVPGSWINSNFNVWIGAPEDNKSWDYLFHAREYFQQRYADPELTEEQKSLALEELLIAEGSDWNWWYGPEHHSANDPEFDQLYRKHLSNVYQRLGARPPEYLAQPIATGRAAATFSEQTAFIHPQIDGENSGYFDWLGAAHYVADRRNSAMHGKRFVFRSAYAGIDEDHFYCRVDFTDEVQHPTTELLAVNFTVCLNIERWDAAGQSDEQSYGIDVQVVDGKLHSWKLRRSAAAGENGTDAAASDRFEVRVSRVLEFKIALDYLHARIGDTLQVKVSAWENDIPVDALPEQGSIPVRVLSERELSKVATGEHWNA